MSDERILITDANGGMGIRTCRKLIAHGHTNLVLGCRSTKSAQATQEILRTESPQAAESLIWFGALGRLGIALFIEIRFTRVIAKVGEAKISNSSVDPRTRFFDLLPVVMKPHERFLHHLLGDLTAG